MINKLTREEERVCECLIKGLSNKQIADKLGKSESTVKLQINSAFKVTKTYNRVGLAIYYLKIKGLIKGDKE